VAATQTRPGRIESNGGQPPAEARRLRPRRGLPGGRAVVGGLLVAVAAVGIFAAVSGAGRGPDTSYVVAARDVAPGSILSADDLELVAMDLPRVQQSRVFTSLSSVDGAVAVGPMSEGELVQAGALADGADAVVPTFSVSLDEADANAGELQRGDIVQVFATYGSDTAGTTVALSSEARVIGVSTAEETVSESGQIVLRLEVESAEERSAIINATVTGRLAVVRTTGSEDPTTSERFRPPVDPDTAEGASTTTTEASSEEGSGSGSGSGGG